MKLNEPITSVGQSVGKYRWTICALLFFATTVNYLDRQVLSLLAPALSTEFGWSNTDYANIARVIAQGQGEMPALGNALSPAEIEAIAKHVVKTLGTQQRSLNNQGRPVPDED